MKRFHQKLFNLFAFAILAFALYLNFFYKEDTKPIVTQDTQVQKETNQQKLNSTGKTTEPEKKAQNNPTTN